MYPYNTSKLTISLSNYRNITKTAWRRREGPDHVETPTSKRPRWRYSDEAVGRNMRLFAEELTILAPAHEILRVGDCSGPPEASPVCFPNQRS
jgi:hypothetical protein